MGRKNTLIGIFVIITLLSISVLVYQFIFDKIKQEQAVIQTKTREFTEQERLLKQQSAELNTLRKQYQIQSTSSATTTLSTQNKNLNTLQKKTTLMISKKTVKQQAQELDALRASLK